MNDNPPFQLKPGANATRAPGTTYGRLVDGNLSDAAMLVNLGASVAKIVWRMWDAEGHEEGWTWIDGKGMQTWMR